MTRCGGISSTDLPEIRLDAFTAITSQTKIRNKRFTDVLVKDNRLVDKNENLLYDQSMSLTLVTNKIRPRTEGYSFSGKHSLKVISFHRHLTRIANQSRLSEATVLWIVEGFVQSPARDSFRAQAHQTWPV
jgi:hypothetical protein